MSSLKSFAQCCRAMATLSRWTSPQYCRGPSTSYRNRKVLGGTGCSHRRHWLCISLPSTSPGPLCMLSNRTWGRKSWGTACSAKKWGKRVSVPCSQISWGRAWLGAACPAAWALLWAFLKWLQSHTHPLLTVMLSYSEISSLTLFFEGYLQTTQNVSSSFSWFLMHLYRDGVGNDCCIQEGFVWRMIWGWFLWKPLKRNLVLLENEKSPTSMSHVPFLMFSL